MTDHGPALPRAKSTLYDAGTGIAMIVRPRRLGVAAAGLRRTVQRRRPAADPAGSARCRQYPPRSTVCRMPAICSRTRQRQPVRAEVYTTKTYHDSFDPIRAIRTKEYSYIENYASRPLLDLPWDIADSAPGRPWRRWPGGQRPERELYDLVDDPTESETCWPRRHGQGRGDRQRSGAAAERLAPEDQRRHPVRIRRHPDLRSATPRRICISTAGDEPLGDRTDAASRTTSAAQ